MKAVEIFDVCHGRYRNLREWLEDTSSSIRLVNLKTPSPGYQWRPERAGLRISGRLRAHRAARAAASGVEGKAEAVRDLFFGQL